MKRENERYVQKLAEEQNKIIKEQEERALEEALRIEKENKEKERFSSLTEENLLSIDRIYRKSEPKRIFLTFDDGPTTRSYSIYIRFA